MHLLAAQPGTIVDGADAVDLGQSPGDVVVLTAADTELALLAAARARVAEKDFPSLRLANPMNLGHNLSVDIYVENVIAHARLVVVRLLGGRAYWRYGADEVARVAAEKKIPVAFIPGDDQPDAELAAISTVGPEARHRLWQYLVHGGADNADDFLKYAASLIGGEADWREPRPLVRAGLYWPGMAGPDLAAIKKHWKTGAPVAALVFYRALVQAGNTAAVDALIEGLSAAGLNPLPVFVASLKDPVAKATLETLLAAAPPAVALNTTGFALSMPGAARRPTPFEDGRGDAAPVVLQVVFSGGGRDAWAAGTRGLSARDIAMNVALPEVDGRVIGRAVSFKGLQRRDDLTETDVVHYAPEPDRVQFVSALAGAWAALRLKPAADRRLGLVLANYPNRDGRIGNGVGLDTPQGAINVLRALRDAGYRTGELPADGAALVDRLLAGPTNDLNALAGRAVDETLSMADYQFFFRDLPQSVQDAVLGRWGAPEADPFFRPGEVDCGRFAVPAFCLGNVAICLQPARGYNVDPKSSYHDPALPPPHNYLAFYAWLRFGFRADAVVHFGKHGNLEWLPGKALALSAACFPEAALGPLPNLYPFIVNDPGEGTQAKRRAQAVIVDHLTPPLTRAESYGPLRDLEQLVDEYYEAAGLDPRRLRVLTKEILELCQAIGLDRDCGIRAADGEGEALAKLDSYLCELKEMQIRDGLHVFGQAPEGRLLTDLLVALVRVPRNAGAGADASLTRALGNDLGLGFDPLDCDMARPWPGPRPEIL
ncbi:MAG TPA: cobaltochelatase subunit CobN, partial [Rhodospirillales bacterium]